MRCPLGGMGPTAAAPGVGLRCSFPARPLRCPLARAWSRSSNPEPGRGAGGILARVRAHSQPATSGGPPWPGHLKASASLGVVLGGVTWLLAKACEVRGGERTGEGDAKHR